MTVRKQEYTPVYNGLAADARPILESGSTHYLPAGSKFIALDSGEKSIFSGGTWYNTNRYYLDDRVSVTINTTSTNVFSGTSLTKGGDLLRQYTVSLANSTGDQTRTLSILDANSVTVWASTAITDSTALTRLLPTSEQVILDGTYTVKWTLSDVNQTTGAIDYYTLGFDRG